MKSKIEKVKKKTFCCALREDLLLAVKSKAQTQDVRMKTIVEKAFQEFLKEK